MRTNALGPCSQVSWIPSLVSMHLISLCDYANTMHLPRSRVAQSFQPTMIPLPPSMHIDVSIANIETQPFQRTVVKNAQKQEGGHTYYHPRADSERDR